MPVRVVDVSFYVMTLRTRMPFRYGIASLTACPHLFVRVVAEIDGKRQVGLSADNLPPKWFTKDPGTTYERDLWDMVEVIRVAAGHAKGLGMRGTVYESWQGLYAAQKDWAVGTPHPPLLWNFGVSLIERAVIDAYCRATGRTFHGALATGALGMSPEVVARALPTKPADMVIVRHAVGLSDPLTAEEVRPEERVDDGLPQTLEESIDAYGLRGFKIKLSGDVRADLNRLRRLARLLESKLATQDWDGGEGPPYLFTLDGNENFRSLSAFQELWAELRGSPELRTFLTRMAFVEQPLHRDVALDVDLNGWEERPRMIIDESDAELGSVGKALRLGYVGTSHKNCKGVFKGIANLLTLKEWDRQHPSAPKSVLSGEDLTNVPPVALTQDLAVMATLGVSDLERNGQHYVRGMMQLPEAVQLRLLDAHPDLFRVIEGDLAAVMVRHGMMALRTVNEAPFGYAIDFDPADYFPRLEEWSPSAFKT